MGYTTISRYNGHIDPAQLIKPGSQSVLSNDYGFIASAWVLDGSVNSLLLLVTQYTMTHAVFLPLSRCHFLDPSLNNDAVTTRTTKLEWKFQLHPSHTPFNFTLSFYPFDNPSLSPLFPPDLYPDFELFFLPFVTLIFCFNRFMFSSFVLCFCFVFVF